MSLGLSHVFRWSSFSSAALLAVVATPALAVDAAPAAPPAKPDYTAPAKHIALNDSGSVWLDFGGQLRARHEYWNNFNTGKTEGGFLLTRVLASADLHVGEQVRVFVEGQSAFSTDRDLPGGRRTLDVDELNLQQAYVELAVPTGGDLKTSVKAGRMGFNFGKQRLVSTLPWANTQRAWDGVDAVFKYEGWQADAFYTEFAPVQKYDFDTADGQTQFYGAYATGPLAGETLKMDAYALGLTLSDQSECDTDVFHTGVPSIRKAVTMGDVATMKPTKAAGRVTRHPYKEPTNSHSPVFPACETKGRCGIRPSSQTAR